MISEAPPGLIRLEKAHVGPASRMLARAFRDDPLVSYAYPGTAGDDVRLPFFYEVPLRYGIRKGCAFTTSPQLEGVAVWARLAGFSMSFRDILLSGAFWPALRMGRGPGSRMRKVINCLEKKHRALLPGEHWYLMLLGVDPDCQGHGFAGRLLRGMFARIDEEGLASYLETETGGNVGFYEHFGFRVVEDFIVPEAGVRMWTMLRDGRRG